MLDQATELRQLMQSLSERSQIPAARPRMVVTAGSTRAVGATTIAVNLAVELTRHGRRVVLVDAEPAGDATRLCRLHEPSAAHRNGFSGASIADVLLGRRNIGEAICRGVHGLRVVGNAAQPARELHPTNDELALLGAQIATLGHEAELAIIDAGCGHTNAAGQLSQQADCMLLVTTASDASVMETYASIKRISATAARPNIAVLFSRADSIGAAEDAFARLVHGCQRFLGMAINYAGCVLEDKTVADAAACAAPFVVLSPRCDAARGLQQAAENMIQLLAPESARQSVEGVVAPDGATEARTLLAMGEAA
jgi:flagellar biosynthesis protein FlhG